MDGPAARTALEPWLLGSTRIVRARKERESWPDTDLFDLRGTVVLERLFASAVTEDGWDEVQEGYRHLGFTELPRDSHRADEVARLRLEGADPSNPFLREREVQVGIAGRRLLGSQRELLREKMRSLRRELTAVKPRSRRFRKATRMLNELQAGLLTRVWIEVRRKVFRADPLLEEGAVMGELLPLGRLSQLEYHVVPRAVEAREAEGARPMYITLLGVSEDRVSFLFSGGIAGRRTVTDLRNGGAHHAWFQNRKRVETQDTAPWISRRVLDGLLTRGVSEVILRRGRDDAPVPLTARGEGSYSLLVEGGRRELPVVEAVSEKQDRLWILKDPENPLVLRLEESGAELLRTVEAVRRLEET